MSQANLLPLRRRLVMRLLLAAAGLVLVLGLGLTRWVDAQQRRQQEELFLQLARADAQFVRGLKLPLSAKLAADLGSLLGMQVHFRFADGRLEPALQEVERQRVLLALVEGRVHALDQGWQAVAEPVSAQAQLILLRRVEPLTMSLANRDSRWVWPALLVVGSLFALLLARLLVRPIEVLTEEWNAALDQPGKPLAGMQRDDEIGVLARALVQGRDAWHAEREQRLSAERLALLGRMATALAHEIKNPLAAIQLHAQLVDVERLDGESRQSLELMQREATEIEGLVNQWLFLARPAPPQQHPLDLVELLRAAMETVRAQAQHAQVEVRMAPPPQAPCMVCGDRRRLLQALRNVLLNAIEAMPGGGRLQASLQVTADQVILAIEDDGPGFSQEAMARASELFFSQKEGGMGVGLCVVQEVLQAHGGRLVIGAARQAGGARVELQWPSAPEC